MAILFSSAPYQYRRGFGLDGHRALAPVHTLEDGKGILIAKMYIDGDWIVMEGVTGIHRIAVSASDDERISIHWKGFRERCQQWHERGVRK